MAKKDLDYWRLCNAIQSSRRTLEFYRVQRREMVRQFVGQHWSDEGTAEEVYINLLSMYVSIVGRSLIAKSPRVMLSTFQRQNKPTVKAMEAWANPEIESTKVAETLQRVVVDALFSVGIAKVALATPADSAGMAWTLPAGVPFVARVDLDDFVYDSHARAFEEVSFMGHRYRAPLEVIRESKEYGKGRKNLQASTDPYYNEQGDERINVLGRGMHTGDQEEFEDWVDLWEIYLPRHRLILTLADLDIHGPSMPGPGGAEPLRVQKWIGPDSGPFHILPFGIVPGNAMPKAPIQDVLDLHVLANHLFAKLARQAQRQKETMWVQGAADADGTRIMNANDGDILRVDNPEAIKQTKMGGPDPANLAYFNIVKDLFSWGAGNLDIMGGLSPQSKTATQDRMLDANSSKAISSMQDATISFTADVLKAVCWFWWQDPFRVMRSTHSLKGLPDMSTTREVTPQQRQMSKWEDLQIEVDPYSMQHSTPQSRLAALNQVVTQTVIPLMPMLQQQGISFDMNAYLEKVATYLDMPDLSDIITIQEPTPQQPGQSEQPGMPQETTRNYVRESMPGRTPHGDNMNRTNALMGIDPGGDPNQGKGPQ